MPLSSATFRDVEPMFICCSWQVIAIGREEVWPLLKRSAELGGNVRTGLEDTFYKPDGSRATSRLMTMMMALMR